MKKGLYFTDYYGKPHKKAMIDQVYVYLHMKWKSIQNSISVKYGLLGWILCQLLGILHTSAQSDSTQLDSLAADSVNRTRIKIVYSDQLSFEKRDGEAVKKLIGNVHIIQDSTDFFCDSAYHFELANRLEAYNNVRILMADSMELISDRLEYDVTSRIADAYDNIVLTDGLVTLKTDRLTYYRDEAWGKYVDGGTLEDTANVLTSIYGYYYPNQDEAFFKEEVTLVNPDYILETDTLGYNTETQVATFLAPTVITSEDGVITTNKGTYATQQKKIDLVSRASVADSSYTLTADSLNYDNQRNLGLARGDVRIEQADSSLQVIGNFGYFNRSTNESLITDEAVAIQLFDDDTLYMFADTLYSFEDSLGNRTFKAYYDVSFFMNQLQGIADSLVYQYVDSTIVLYSDPVVWSGESQLSGDTIFIQMEEGKTDSMWVGKNSFLVSREDTVGYNQVKGKEMQANFKDNQLSRLHVVGNSESIYYSKNESGEYEGMNEALSQEMIIYLKDNQATRIIFLANPEGKFYPIYEVLFEDYILDDMEWRVLEKPLKPEIDSEGIPIPRRPVFAAQPTPPDPSGPQ